jgi:hypothetical protein
MTWRMGDATLARVSETSEAEKIKKKTKEQEKKKKVEMVNWLPFIASLLVNNILPHSTTVRHGVPDPPTTNLSAWPNDSNLKLDKIAELEIYNTHMPSYARVTLKCPQRQTVCSVEHVGIPIPNSNLMDSGYSAENYAADVGPFLEDLGRWADNMTDFEKLGVQPNSEVVAHPDVWWYTVQISINAPWVPRQDILEILTPDIYQLEEKEYYFLNETIEMRVVAETSDLCITRSCKEIKETEEAEGAEDG